MTAIPTMTDAMDFKALVEKHKDEEWINLPNDKKLFVCWYIRSGYSTHKMLDVGISDQEVSMYLSDPLTQAAIADVGQQYSEVTTFTRVGLQARLSRALDMALGEIERPVYDKEGNVYHRRVVDLTSAARLLEMAEKYVNDPNADDEAKTPAPWEVR